MTKPVHVLAAAVIITLTGIVPALAAPRIKPRIPLPAPSVASAQSSSSSSSADFQQESRHSREFKGALLSDITAPTNDGSAKSEGASSSSAGHRRSH